MDVRLLQIFAYGVCAGLLFAVYVWWRGWLEQRRLGAEIKKLREHLQSHMEISHEGNVQRREELDRLRTENENLRVTVKAWQQKPDRRELRMLHVYDQAARQLMKTAPGFAPHWEGAVEAAERVIEAEDRGVFAFARRLVLPRARVAEVVTKDASADASEDL